MRFSKPQKNDKSLIVFFFPFPGALNTNPLTKKLFQLCLKQMLANRISIDRTARDRRFHVCVKLLTVLHEFLGTPPSPLEFQRPEIHTDKQLLDNVVPKF